MILPRRVAGILMAAYVLVVGWIVFLPTAAVASGSVNIIATLLHAVGFPLWVSPTMVEFVTNVLLFMPLSFLGRSFLPRWGWGWWALAGLAGTLLIEVVQHLLLPGRSAQAMDVVANTLGAVAGFAASLLSAGSTSEAVTPPRRGR